MSLVNYVLIGLLGTILAIALYSARMDMSGSNTPDQGQVTVVV
ncbi:hypothetical protein ABMC88_03140 [Sulfitobacter sp. HNIBRBA2951]